MRRRALDGRVSYLEWDGPSGATLVCLHPIGKDASTWDTAGPLLARVARVVAPDLPGHGESAPCRRASIEEQAARVAAFVRELGEGDTVIVGDSLGGAVGAVVAGRVPAAAAVFLSSYFPPFYAGRHAPAVVAGLVATRVGEAGWSWQRRVLERVMGREQTRGGGGPRASYVARLQLSLAAASAWPSRAHRWFDAMTCPVLVLHGTADHQVPIGWAQRFASQRPRTTLRELAEVGHLSELDDPHWWVDGVTQWIAATVPAAGRAAVSRA